MAQRCPAIVRLTSNHPDQIKRVMDAGATGVMVPMVRTAADAELPFRPSITRPAVSEGWVWPALKVMGRDFNNTGVGWRITPCGSDD